MTIQEIKHLFFAYRNGVVAEALRRSGMPYAMIFGVDVPTLASIARRIGYDRQLAGELWKDREVRESRLLACYLFDPESLPLGSALVLCRDIRTPEEADMLAFRLLKRLPYAQELLAELQKDPQTALAAKSLSRHC